MKMSQNPKEIVEALIPRSTCRIQMAAVIADKKGVFAWGWNHAGANGLGLCAERYAIRRANRKRLPGATIYIAGRWLKWPVKLVPAIPCDKCKKAIWLGALNVVYRGKDGKWVKL